VLRKTDQPEFYNVALRENYERRAPGALRAQKAVTAQQAGEDSRYGAFHWTGQDQYLSPATTGGGRSMRPTGWQRKTIESSFGPHSTCGT